jgi:hypothetical protein
MATRDLFANLRHPIVGARRLGHVVWIAPYLLVWILAAAVLKAGAMGADCTTVCLVARGWLWYTVFYATLSLSAFVGAIEILVWLSRRSPVQQVKLGSAQR